MKRSESARIHVASEAMRGKVSIDPATFDLYIHPDDWENIEVVAAEKFDYHDVTTLFGVKVVHRG